MAGTKAGAAKTVATNKERYGEDFYKKMGAKGGKVTGVAKGFASNLDRAREAGRRGGRISKRGPAKKDDNVQ